MENPTNTIGFCLLPSELIQNILLYLASPEILSMKLVNKYISHVVFDQHFMHECNSRSKSATWLFVYKKPYCRDTVLQGFSDKSTRWFNIAIPDLLKSVVSPGEDLYFLTACGNVFLFVSNTRQEIISVNLVTKTVQKIPPSPLGPRGTSSWRRSGFKLLATLDYFRFLFAELVENRPVLFDYNSETDTWTSTEAIENVPFVNDDYDFLNVINRPNESIIIAIKSQSNFPMIVRPRFNVVENERQELAVGFTRGTSRLHVYGDGHMMIVRSNNVDNVNTKVVRKLKEIELWGLSQNGAYWEFITRVPSDLMTKINNKPYGVMMGCLEKSNGVIKIVLVSNYECLWEIIWLSYDQVKNHWSWVQLPDCNMKGSNMAGITFSTGLGLAP